MPLRKMRPELWLCALRRGKNAIPLNRRNLEERGAAEQERTNNCQEECRKGDLDVDHDLDRLRASLLSAMDQGHLTIHHLEKLVQLVALLTQSMTQQHRPVSTPHDSRADSVADLPSHLDTPPREPGHGKAEHVSKAECSKKGVEVKGWGIGETPIQCSICLMGSYGDQASPPNCDFPGHAPTRPEETRPFTLQEIASEGMLQGDGHDGQENCTAYAEKSPEHDSSWPIPTSGGPTPHQILPDEVRATAP
eukprot:jgi/Botrbrau1/6057/Bobra.0042s0037.1